jgi:hypothetical protein
MNNALYDPQEPSYAFRIDEALQMFRTDTATQTQGTVSPDFQCSREGTTGKLKGYPIVVMHSCAFGRASPCWLVVYVGKGWFFHVDARRAFNNAPWYGEQLHGAEQRRRFLRDLNDRFPNIDHFADWAQVEDMPRINQELNQSPIEDPKPNTNSAATRTKGNPQ